MGLIAIRPSNQDDAGHCIEFLTNLLNDYPNPDFRIRLWDGTIWGSAPVPRFTLALNHPGTLRRLCDSPSELTLGESYIYNDLDIEGDIEGVFDLGDFLLALGNRNLLHRAHLSKLFRSLPNEEEASAGRYRPIAFGGTPHSRSRDRQAVRYHYDLPREFFALWLDRGMVYSSAYFTSAEESNLDAAQHRKLDYICKKLRLRPGDSLLDIGCGWGQLLIHAAASYGIRGVGITLSVPQAEAARQRIRDAGLNHQCRIEVCDYRDLEEGLLFDKIVSVGMFEHVGEERLPEYFSGAWQRLMPGGAFLISGISASATEHRQGPSFIDRYVFPDGDLVPISASLAVAEKTGFEVTDVENLREHYALTLRRWVRRLEAHAEEARRLTDETTYRIWRLYMAGSAHRFSSGRLNLYQTLLLKSPAEKSIPLTRTDWYRDRPECGGYPLPTPGSRLDRASD